jgi:putative MATE family efflux protein
LKALWFGPPARAWTLDPVGRSDRLERGDTDGHGSTVLELDGDEITEGRLLRVLLVLALPLLVQNFVQVANQVVDLFFLGRLSEAAVAGVALASPAVVLLFALSVYTPFVGTQVLVSQRVGADDGSGAVSALGAGLLVAAVGGVLLGALAFLAAPRLTDLLVAVQPTTGETASVRGFAVDYLRVVAAGLVAVTLADTVEAAFIGWGDSRAALYINLVTVGVNVALDPPLIFGMGPFPRLEVAGAGVALVAGSVAGMATGAVLASTGRVEGYRLGEAVRSAVSVDREEVDQVLDVGTPTAAQQATRQVVNVLMVVVVFAAGGAAGLAAYLVGARVAAVSFVPATGLQQAAQSVVGQNLGAGGAERARRATWLGTAVAVLGLAVIGAIQWVLAPDVVGLLVPELDGRGGEFSVAYLRILAYGYPAIGAAYLLEGGFNGARRTRTSLAATLLQFWVVRLPVAGAGAFLLGWGVEAVFWAVTVSNVLVAVGLAAYYRHAVADGMLARAASEAPD